MKKEDIKVGIKFYIENPKRIYKITKLDNDVVTYKSLLSGIKYKTPITPSFLCHTTVIWYDSALSKH